MRKTQGAVALFAIIMVCGLFVAVGTNPLVVSGQHSDLTGYNVGGQTVVVPGSAPINLVYSGSPLSAWVTYTLTGGSAVYTLEYSIDGTNFISTGLVTTPSSGRVDWTYAGDWSTWQKVKLSSTSDPLLIGLPQNL